jgi:hypothetical protein
LFVPTRWRVAWLVLAAWGVAACSPTFNWRELRLDGAPLQALLPCKPESANRSVPMLGQPTELHMHSCEAGGLTFAVAWAELADAGRVGEALDQWQSASLAAIRVAPDAGQPWTAQIAGASTVRGLNAQGSDHQGRALQSRVAYFAQGNKVYQAAIYGPKIPTEAGSTFFDGLSFQ